MDAWAVLVCGLDHVRSFGHAGQHSVVSDTHVMEASSCPLQTEIRNSCFAFVRDLAKQDMHPSKSSAGVAFGFGNPTLREGSSMLS